MKPNAVDIDMHAHDLLKKKPKPGCVSWALCCCPLQVRAASSAAASSAAASTQPKQQKQKQQKQAPAPAAAAAAGKQQQQQQQQQEAQLQHLRQQYQRSRLLDFYSQHLSRELLLKLNVRSAQQLPRVKSIDLSISAKDLYGKRYVSG
jgi:hypothetical protein